MKESHYAEPLSEGPSSAAAPRLTSRPQRGSCLAHRQQVFVSLLSRQVLIRLHHSYRITLSALASTFGGIMRPICLAVFRLITNSNFVGCSTGRSEGFAPFRILSTTDATRWFLSGASYPYDMSPPASTSVRLLNIAGSRFLRRAR